MCVWGGLLKPLSVLNTDLKVTPELESVTCSLKFSRADNYHLLQEISGINNLEFVGIFKQTESKNSREVKYPPSRSDVYSGSTTSLQSLGLNNFQKHTQEGKRTFMEASTK